VCSSCRRNAADAALQLHGDRLSLSVVTLLCYLGNNYFQLLDSVVLNRLLIGCWVSDLPWEIITQCVFGFVENKLNNFNNLETNENGFGCQR
jgi:hypothetical protein